MKDVDRRGMLAISKMYGGFRSCPLHHPLRRDAASLGAYQRSLNQMVTNKLSLPTISKMNVTRRTSSSPVSYQGIDILYINSLVIFIFSRDLIFHGLNMILRGRGESRIDPGSEDARRNVKI